MPSYYSPYFHSLGLTAIVCTLAELLQDRVDPASVTLYQIEPLAVFTWTILPRSLDVDSDDKGFVLSAALLVAEDLNFPIPSTYQLYRLLAFFLRDPTLLKGSPEIFPTR